MIQELLGGSSVSTPILTTTTTSIPSSMANSSNSPFGVGNNTTANRNHNTSSEANTSTTSQQNLRCPRCDSTNTKFCYYNNYNLTQPRHFCKTCRRYWTKGGTLRNVPIGGGCRKNKSTTSCGSSVSSGFVKSSSNAMAKAKASLSTELLVNGNPGFLGPGFFDHLNHHPELQYWPSLPQNSHIWSLLRGSTQFHNPNPNPNPNQLSNIFSPVKTEGSTSTSTTTTTTLGLDPLTGGPSNLLGSFSRSNQQQVNGSYSSGVQDFSPNNGNNSNILELYQRLKSSSNHHPYFAPNMVGSVSPSSPIHSTILDSGPVGGGDHFGGYGFMNSPAIMSGWSDFSTVPINGAYP